METSTIMKYEVGKKRNMRKELDRLLDHMHFNGYIEPKYTGNDSASKELREFYFDMFVINEPFLVYGVDGVFFVHPYVNDDDDIPNFYFDDKDLKISWHMVPFRNAKSNVPITVEQFAKIIDTCILAVEIVKEGYMRR